MLPSTNSGKTWPTSWAVALCLASAFGIDVRVSAAQPAEMFELWPSGSAPGTSRVHADEPERLVTVRRRTFDQLTNIAIPKVAVFLAPKEKRTGGVIPN